MLYEFLRKKSIFANILHTMTISQFSRACSHYDIKVRSYIIGWYLFWYQWKEKVHSYTLVTNLGYYDIQYL